ncbi:MAG: hypothetical protein ACRDV3_05400 [Acidothermaceae bacterium]
MAVLGDRIREDFWAADGSLRFAMRIVDVEVKVAPGRAVIQS